MLPAGKVEARHIENSDRIPRKSTFSLTWFFIGVVAGPIVFKLGMHLLGRLILIVCCALGIVSAVVAMRRRRMKNWFAIVCIILNSVPLLLFVVIILRYVLILLNPN
jgi:uncharacterized membrane protein HdeD (DUF308 family)